MPKDGTVHELTSNVCKNNLVLLGKIYSVTFHLLSVFMGGILAVTGETAHFKIGMSLASVVFLLPAI